VVALFIGKVVIAQSFKAAKVEVEYAV